MDCSGIFKETWIQSIFSHLNILIFCSGHCLCNRFCLFQRSESCFHLLVKSHFPAADNNMNDLDMKVSSTIKRTKFMHQFLGCFEVYEIDCGSCSAEIFSINIF